MIEDRFKFRAWDEINKVMSYDVTPSAYTSIDCYIWTDVGEYGVHGEIEKEGFCLMQCTGVKDKKGKLIFEGDIVKHRLTQVLSEKQKEIFKLSEDVIVFASRVSYVEWDKEGCDYNLIDIQSGLITGFGHEGQIFEVMANKFESRDVLLQKELYLIDKGL